MESKGTTIMLLSTVPLEIIPSTCQEKCQPIIDFFVLTSAQGPDRPLCVSLIVFFNWADSLIIHDEGKVMH